jgi:phage tail sheath protein FI
MPEYLAPGVYVEEVSFRSKSIEGVSTTTTGFVGAARYGPVLLSPDVVTSLVEYERIYGDRQPIKFGSDTLGIDNYLWHGVRSFFENGGKRLYVARVFRPKTGSVLAMTKQILGGSSIPSGFAASAAGNLRVVARFPGAAGNVRVRITLQAGPNIFDTTTRTARGISHRDVVLTGTAASPPAVNFAVAKFDEATGWDFGTPAAQLDSVRIVTATVTIMPADPSIPSFVYPDLALDAAHRRNGLDDSLAAQFALDQPSFGRQRSIPIVVNLDPSLADGAALLNQIGSLQMPSSPPKETIKQLLAKTTPTSDADRSIDLLLSGGDDGQEPDVDAFEGRGAADPTSKDKSGLKALEDIDEISIVAAPGSSAAADALAIAGKLVSHAERMRYRIAVLDSKRDQSIADVRDMRGKIDSTYAALYYPWITVVDPVKRVETNLPPSGFVAGIYARNDINRGVFKAPANEVIDGAIGLETLLNKSQQDILNPLGINCFRFFEGRGFRLWGARTVSSDPEWKYVNLRRYFAYLEHSIDKGTQWAVFEPNGERLWANVRQTIVDFLFNEWQNGALLGDRAEKAYFVKCDRSTMTQNDLDNGRLVCLVGVAALRPAEFVIIRIGQWTADRKV